MIFISILNSVSYSQFYNGMQMDFGKNRVQYKEFVWQFYRQKKIDTYFYPGGKELAEYTTSIATQRINELESFFGYSLEKRVIFLIYNNLTDFRQSNIGLISGNDQYNIGGTTKVIDNKVFVYYEGDHVNFKRQVYAAIAEVMVNEMIYGSDFKTKVANSTLLSLPEWFYNGLISFLSEEWNVDIDSRVRDGIISGKFEKFNNLSGNEAKFAGHSIWYFVAQKYGKNVIPNILYLTRISKNSESGFLYVLGMPIKYLTFEWLNFFDQRYYADEKKRNIPDSENSLFRTNKNKVYSQVNESQGGLYTAYTSNQMGKMKIYLLNNQDKKQKCIFRAGERIDQITDYSYPLLTWHPSGKILSFIMETQGIIRLYSYDIETGTTDWKQVFNLNKIVDISYSSDGFNFALAGVSNGQTDIYVFNNPSNTLQQITNDPADDRYPRFINKSTEILFSSNRLSDTLGLSSKTDYGNPAYDVFICDYKNKPNVLKRITSTPASNEIQPFQTKKNEFVFLSDSNGIYNRTYAKFDSTISFIDTTTHYRYLTMLNPLTNYSRNILEHSPSGNAGTFHDIVYYKGKHNIFKGDEGFTFTENYPATKYKDIIHKKRAELDSLNVIRQQEIKQPDSVAVNEALTFYNDSGIIDVNNYIFEFQKNRQKGHLPQSDTVQGKQNRDTSFIFRSMIYHTAFYTNSFIGQVDFGFLSNSYQPFTGGPFYFNPGFNVFFKIGTTDLFEDYKITGGVRFAGNFDSNEYLLTFENLKKRLDRQIVFHRLALNSMLNMTLIKTHTHEIHYILRYPFSQLFSARMTASLRYDKSTFLSTDLSSLQKYDIYKNWLGVKSEFIYDNTRPRGLNLFNGTRTKFFFEAYKQLNESEANLFVSGFDFRHYHKIHRNIILASRVAASNSFGSRKLIYYLGSVDNWINLSTRVQTFDQSVLIDQNQKYAYQTVATNMRGFTQNIRNGNNFAVINNEIRWPLVKYFTNRPIHSDFIENFQVIGFFDIGTAWSGKSPKDDKNAYNTEVIYQNSITIVIDKDKQPVVYGYGFGLRSRLLGYFVRADWAWGIENNIILPKIFYLSLNLDF